MSSARELALEVLPHFRAAVLARHVYTYGYYAASVGRPSATDGLAVGQAMHAIGAACILCSVPVAPLFYVKRADGEWRRIFESDASERMHVLPHYDLLYVTAREHTYLEKDFEKLDVALRVAFPGHLRADQLSPHDLWHVVIYATLRDGGTILDLALSKYRELFAQLKAQRVQK